MIYYEKRNPESRNSKFYRIWFEEAVLNGTRIFRLWTIRGKLGNRGIRMLEEFTNYDELTERMIELHNKRIEHGYNSRENPTNQQLDFNFC